MKISSEEAYSFLKRSVELNLDSDIFKNGHLKALTSLTKKKGKRSHKTSRQESYRLKVFQNLAKMVCFISTMTGQKRFENICFALDWYKNKINPILGEDQQKIELIVDSDEMYQIKDECQKFVTAVPNIMSKVKHKDQIMVKKVNSNKLLNRVERGHTRSMDVIPPLQRSNKSYEKIMYTNADLKSLRYGFQDGKLSLRNFEKLCGQARPLAKESPYKVKIKRNARSIITQKSPLQNTKKISTYRITNSINKSSSTHLS